MVFNSWSFLPFFFLSFGGYLLLQGRLKWQNRWLLACSFYFYGAYDLRFLGLLLLTSTFDYYATRRRWFWPSVVSNIGLLAAFKLLKPDLIPVGISFYTFQAVGYAYDVCRRKGHEARSLEDFLLFIAYFPQLVAGPISRTDQLTPQLERPRKPTLEGFERGLGLVLAGYVLKLVVADRLGRLVDLVFASPAAFGGADLAIAAACAFLQVYGDFAGYTLIGRGVARMMDIEVIDNFASPLLADSQREFWRRWHLSLSEWFRDLVYVPLGGGPLAALLTLTLCGLWHGASWRFAAWGFYLGVILILPLPKSRLLTFGLMSAGMFLFRAPDALRHLAFTASPHTASLLGYAAFYAAPAFAWDYLRARGAALPKAWRAPAWPAAAVAAAFLGARESPSFIYFQF